MNATPLNATAYGPFGAVIAARADVRYVRANLGFARRYNFLAPLDSTRSGARPNLCVFCCEPMVPLGENSFSVTLLERHPFSTQVFIPMAGVGRYLVIVARGESVPDLGTLRAFLATGQQGVTYAPGVWHHPLVALDQSSDFTCLVWEDGSDGDCAVHKLATPLTIAF